MSTAKNKKQSTIARLPKPDEEAATIDDAEKDAALLALIKKGGRSARPTEALPAEKRISLRISQSVGERIKQAAKARPIKTPSHRWIVEAVLDKLEKEGF